MLSVRSWQLFVFLVAAMSCSHAVAQSYPTKPVTLVIGFPAGGAFDTVMRSIAEEMGKTLGQRVNVDNRAGAGGAIATQVVVGAKADGYTLLAAGLQLATGPHLNKISYNPATDLTMVGQLGYTPVWLLAKGDSPIQNVADIVALAKKNGNGVTIGSGGVGTTGHFGSVILGNSLKINPVHVPFKGGAMGLQALAGGEMDLMFDQMSGVMLGLMQAKKVRVIAVMQNQRVASIPNVKSAAEFGLTLESPLRGWQGIAVRSGTPAPVLQKLTAAWGTAVRSPSVISRAEQLGIELDTGRSPEAFQKHYLAELERWGAFIKKNHITSE